ncbi:MAG: hypothetical protein PHV05_03495 [Candidatus Riflebacteria bacterium]|nr:hypothetical protein [Candidatus Riflebacteria bacterium]
MMALRGQLKHKESLFDMTDPEGMGQLAEGYYTWQQLKGYSEVSIYNTRKNLEYFGKWLLQSKRSGNPFLKDKKKSGLWFDVLAF